MERSDERMRAFGKRLLLSRMRILVQNGFYGLLLMHMNFSLDENCPTAATDGRRIYFGPEFLERLSDSELDFVLMHEILHAALRHCLRQGERDPQQFNIACDIVVNSNILLSNQMDTQSITLADFGESMHIAPNGKEGYAYTAEEVYEMLTPSRSPSPAPGRGGEGGGSGDANSGSGNFGKTGKGTGTSSGDRSRWDDHTLWGTAEEDEELRDLWVKRVEDACEAVSVRDPSHRWGTLPMAARRLIGQLRHPQTDWRTLLNAFVQEEVVDYSFTPPDRRFGDSPFYLPDFNETDELVRDILFMIDTSGSISDGMISAAYSEIKGAIDQFDGKLQGWLGFFDAGIIEPVPFVDEDEFRRIRPAGGGGTDFRVIFEYVRRRMQDHLPASIIILTDGFAPFPPQSAAMGIPVLWLLNNGEVDPPWGKVTRITV